MLLRFTIASVKRTKREYKYYDVFFSGVGSKERTGMEYIVEIAADDGERYFLFHQGKSDPTIRQYRVMYVDAHKMVSGDGTKYSAPHEGAYKVRRLYTKDQFQKAVDERKANLTQQQKTNAAELERLAAYV